MALSFSGTGQYLTTASALVSAQPFTMGCWVNMAVIGSGNALQSISNNSTANSTYINFMVAGPPIKQRAQVTGAGVSHSAVSGVSPAAGSWYHMVAVFTSDTSRTIYLNGIAYGPDTVSDTGAGLNITSIGANFGGSSTALNLVNGSIAYPAIWNIALSGTDVTNLYNSGSGADPATIQASALVSVLYMRSGTPYFDTKGAITWTNVGTPAVVADPFTIAGAPTYTLADKNNGNTPTAATRAVTFALAQDVGSLNIAVVFWDALSGQTVTSISDSVNGAYSTANVKLQNTVNITQTVYYFAGAASCGAGTNVVTVNLSAASANVELRINNFTSTDGTTWTLGQIAAAATNLAAAVTGNITNPNADVLAFCAGCTAGAFTAPGTTWTSSQITSNGSIDEYKIVNPSASIFGAATQGAQAAVIQLATFTARSPTVPVVSINPKICYP